ncbi:MAG TPA: NifU family protein [Pyrinomonadaceae bacterium]|nr:NifU family protein [Pyrinomonadaceae bacterium]
MQDEIRITSEVDRRTPALCRFTVDRTLYIGTKTVNDEREARGMPLAEKLFEIEGVSRIQLIGRLLVVTKSEAAGWDAITERVEAVLTAYFVSGLALSAEEIRDHMMLVGRGAKEKLQYLIDQQINPGVAAHAGFVELIEVKGDTVYLRLGGGCQGCGAADFTLRQGIESVIRREVPEVRRVIDITDHAAGMHPYYRKEDAR